MSSAFKDCFFRGSSRSSSCRDFYMRSFFMDSSKRSSFGDCSRRSWSGIPPGEVPLGIHPREVLLWIPPRNVSWEALTGRVLSTIPPEVPSRIIQGFLQEIFLPERVLSKFSHEKFFQTFIQAEFRAITYFSIKAPNVAPCTQLCYRLRERETEYLGSVGVQPMWETKIVI